MASFQPVPVSSAMQAKVLTGGQALDRFEGGSNLCLELGARVVGTGMIKLDGKPVLLSSKPKLD